MTYLLCALDNVKLDGNCVLGILNLEQTRIMWLKSVEYFNVQAIKKLAEFGAFFVAIVECNPRVSKLCILSKEFEVINVVYRKDLASIKSLYVNNEELLLGAKGVILKVTLNRFGQLVNCSKKYEFETDYICTSMTNYKGKIVCSLFDEERNIGKIVYANSGDCIFEFEGHPSSLLARHDALLFLDAYNSAIHILKEEQSQQIPIKDGYLSLIIEMEGRCLLVKNAWRSLHRRYKKNRRRDKEPEWINGKSYKEKHKCDLVLLDDNFHQIEVYHLSHIAEEISALVPLSQMNLTWLPGGEAERALMLKWKNERTINQIKKIREIKEV